MTNTCTTPGCLCEGRPSLQLLYTERANLGLLVNAGKRSLSDYERLQRLILAHEQAMEAP